MKTSVSEARQCPSCGKPMPAGALAGLCPACLLAQGAETDGGGGARFEPPPLAEVAKLFPQLEILDLLGAGGMGAVYKARQPALDRIVALKILPSQNARGVNFAERFNREARALARLNHPNIVAVHEFGQAGALSYFIMEFVDGANLRLLEQGSRLSPREALQIIPQICDALQYAHDEGVVHRDIKPENVLVDRKGRVKIADFGLAKILGVDAEALRLTAEGQVMGTPHYMAPEQIEKPLSVDHRADIYALGVVLYEMLTGDLPLGKFSPPSRKVQVDVRFDEVVLRALENDPARRYQKASEVKSQVETIAGTPTQPAAPAAPASEKHYIRCAGFPLAIHRDGARVIHWKAAAHAFAVVFGVLTLGFGLVSLFTGNSVMGWLGVVGLPSVVARLALAAVAVGWGIRFALRAKEEPEPLPRTPQGTVILPAEKFSRKAILGAIWAPVIFFAAAGYWLLSTVTVTDQLLILLPGLTAPFGTTILGWMAVGDIRRARGRIAGLPLAVFDGLFFPLLALDGFLIWAWMAIVNGLHGQAVFEPFHAGEVSVLTKLGAAALCVLVDLWIIRRVWRAMLLNGGAQVEPWWSSRKGAIAIGVACALIIAAVGQRREKPPGIFKPAAASAELWSPMVEQGEKPDPNKVFDEAKALRERGEYEQALQRHIWYHNHALEFRPSLTGVRLSFALADWIELGRRYPKARQALIEIRDSKTREIDQGRGHSELFSEISSLNSYLQAEEETSALFKRIHQKDPALAAQCIHYARDALVKSREYELCLKYIPNVQEDFERTRESWVDDKARAESSNNAQQFRQWADKRFVSEVSQLIEILAGAGRKAEAEKIRVQAAALVDDPQFKSAEADPASKSSNLGAGTTLDELPPVIIRTFPVAGTREVEPGVTEIRATFNKDMTDGSWSWSTAWEDSTPAMLDKPRFENDHRTCVIKVKLEPGRTYAWWLNSERFHNFKDKSGRAAVPYLLIFQTKQN